MLEQQLCFLLYVASRKVIQLYTPYLKALDLTYPQVLILVCLWNQDDQKVDELARLLYLDTGTLSPLLKRMEQKKLLKRARRKDDERCVTVQLTKKGHELKEDIGKTVTQVKKHLPSDNSEVLNQQLLTIIRSIESC